MRQAVYTEANALKFEDQDMYLVEGTLSELQTARTTINLLEQIEGNVKAKSMVAGAAAVLSGMHGIVANSAAIALYDGEETCHFAGLLDDQVICGTFQNAENIKNGDRVKAVVSKRGDALFAHSIMNAKTQEFYMPLNEFASEDGLFAHCMRVALWMWIWTSAILFLILLFMGAFFDSKMPLHLRVILLVATLVGPALIVYPFEYWTYRSFSGGKKHEAEESYAGAIFKVFGFPQPHKIDLMKHSDLSLGENGGWYAAWRVDKLLAKLKA